MTIPVRYIQYGFGQHKIFYVTEGGEDVNPLPTVTCYFPDKDNITEITLEHLDTGIYCFSVFFRAIGNHLFVFFEGEGLERHKTGMLNAIIKDRMI